MGSRSTSARTWCHSHTRENTWHPLAAADLDVQPLQPAVDAGADGYVRAGGAGLVLPERRAGARAAGRRVLAVIRESAMNQDGRTSGLTAPRSGGAQR